MTHGVLGRGLATSETTSMSVETFHYPADASGPDSEGL